MKRVREQMATHEVAIDLTDEAKELLVEKGYDPAMGARPLRRAIQRVIEDPLADFVLGRTLEPGSTILVARKGETEEVDMTVIPGEVTPEKVTVPPEEPSDTADEPEPVEEWLRFRARVALSARSRVHLGHLAKALARGDDEQRCSRTTSELSIELKCSLSSVRCPT